MKNDNRVFSSVFLVSLFGFAVASFSQSLPIQYEELTTPEFIDAVAQSNSTCLIPIGVLEKHGPHLPLGTDMIDVRQIALRAAKKEYTSTDRYRMMINWLTSPE